VASKAPIIPPLFCSTQLLYNEEYGTTTGRLVVTLGIKPSSSVNFSSKTKAQLEDVVVTIPLPRTVRTANLTVSTGTFLYDEATKVAKWTMGKMGKDRSPQMTGEE